MLSQYCWRALSPEEQNWAALHFQSIVEHKEERNNVSLPHWFCPLTCRVAWTSVLSVSKGTPFPATFLSDLSSSSNDYCITSECQSTPFKITRKVFCVECMKVLTKVHFAHTNLCTEHDSESIPHLLVLCSYLQNNLNMPLWNALARQIQNIKATWCNFSTLN